MYTAVYKHLAIFIVDFACFLESMPFVRSVFHWPDVLLGIRHLPASSSALHGFFSGCMSGDVAWPRTVLPVPLSLDLSCFPLSPAPSHCRQVPTAKPDKECFLFPTLPLIHGSSVLDPSLGQNKCFLCSRRGRYFSISFLWFMWPQVCLEVPLSSIHE